MLVLTTPDQLIPSHELDELSAELQGGCFEAGNVDDPIAFPSLSPGESLVCVCAVGSREVQLVCQDLEDMRETARNYFRGRGSAEWRIAVHALEPAGRLIAA